MVGGVPGKKRGADDNFCDPGEGNYLPIGRPAALPAKSPDHVDGTHNKTSAWAGSRKIKKARVRFSRLPTNGEVPSSGSNHIQRAAASMPAVPASSFWQTNAKSP